MKLFNLGPKNESNKQENIAPVPMKVVKTEAEGKNLVKRYFNTKLNVSYELEFIPQQDGEINKLLKNVYPVDLGTTFKLKDDGPLDRPEYFVSEAIPKDEN